MAISRIDAIEAAKTYVKGLHRGSGLKSPLVVLEDQIVEEDFGWVIPYNVENYKLRDPDGPPPVLGNAPLIVSRNDGRIHEMGTAQPESYYIELFRRTGSTDEPEDS
jgi:hypothetical protein